MVTLSHSTSISVTDRRNRRRLLTLASSYKCDTYTLKETNLPVGTSEIIAVKAVFLAAFTRPTLIRIGDTLGQTIDLTVAGTVCLPMAGSVEIVNPASATIQEPIRVTYISG